MGQRVRGLLAVLTATCVVAGCGGGKPVRMLFLPSSDRAAMTGKAAQLARAVQQESGLQVVSDVAASYSAGIETVTAGKADVAWLPPVAYLIAASTAGVEAKLRVMRTQEVSAIVVARVGAGEPASLADLAGKPVALSSALGPELGLRVRAWLSETAPGWVPARAAGDLEAVRHLLDAPGELAAVVSSSVIAGPLDLTGDGRRELEAERPGTLAATRVIGKLPQALKKPAPGYRGCFIARTDSGVRNLADLNGRSILFADETSASGFIFPRALLASRGVTPGEERFAGSHPAVVEAVWKGEVAAGAVFYSPAGEEQLRDGSLVGDARGRVAKGLASDAERERLLREVRVIAVTDIIPNDVCCVRKGFSPKRWQRVEAAIQRVLTTPEGRQAFFDLLGATGVEPTNDAAMDGFRRALREAGVTAETLLKAAEAKLKTGS